MAKFKVGDIIKHNNYPNVNKGFNKPIIMEIISVDDTKQEYGWLCKEHYSAGFIGKKDKFGYRYADNDYSLYTAAIPGSVPAQPIHKFNPGDIVRDKTIKDPIIRIDSVDVLARRYKGVVTHSSNHSLIGSTINDDIAFIDQFYESKPTVTTQPVNVPAGQGLATPVSTKPRFQVGDVINFGVNGNNYEIVSIDKTHYSLTMRGNPYAERIDFVDKAANLISTNQGLAIELTKKIVEEHKKCSCSMNQLMHKNGCVCGAIKKYKSLLG